MKTLGIDQASHTGFAVAVNGKLSDSGTVVFKGDIGKRLYDFHQWLLLKCQEELPDLIVYEKPHFRGYAATLSGVGMISIIQMVAYRVGIPTLGVHTATLKKFATGYGRADKSKMTEAANAEDSSLHLKTKENNDEADAIHLALYGGRPVNDADGRVRTRTRGKRGNK